VGHQLETLNDCIDLVREQGMVVAFGVPDQDVYPLAFETLFRKNVALVACVTPPWAAYLAKARDLFDSCRPDLATFFTRRYPMRDAAEAFAAYERREPGLIKLILDASDWEPSRPVRQAAATASRR
jgi:threonine dehydrogenase-like Zn-dependent dehydrogenase